MANPNPIILFLPISFALILSFSSHPVSAQTRSICITQFALANQACSVLPSLELQPATITSSHNNSSNNNNNNDGRGNDHPEHDHRGHNGHRRRSEHGDAERHHRHRAARRIPRVYKDCCRWLEEVNNECVCEVLKVLPPFLVKHHHNYTVKVDDACSFTYKCYAA